MRTSRLIAILVGALAASVMIAGCSSASDTAAAATEVKTSPEKMGAGDNVDQSGAQEIHDPKQVKQGGSYKLTPPDPDNPNFKPDPKLGGGG